jgi:hypothetical protein
VLHDDRRENARANAGIPGRSRSGDTGSVADEGPSDRDDSVITGHRFDSAEVDQFEVSTAFGHGQPNYFVCLDTGLREWWFSPRDAERLARRLHQLAADCDRLQAEHEERQNRPYERVSAGDSDHRRYGPEDFRAVPWPSAAPTEDGGEATEWALQLERVAEDEDAALVSERLRLAQPGLTISASVHEPDTIVVRFRWSRYDGDALALSVAAMRLAVEVLPVRAVQSLPLAAWAAFHRG